MKTILLVKFVLLTGAAIFNALIQVGKIPADAWSDSGPFFKVCQQGPQYPEPCCSPWDLCDS